MFMTRIRFIASSLYNTFLLNRNRFARPLLFGVLLLSLVLGASYRIISIRENFEVVNGFEHYVNMASHFWSEPGGYNFDSGVKMKERPDDYVFTRHPREGITGSFENEKGWEFILSLIFKEGTKGIQNLALDVVRYQVMLDLFVIVLLFWGGKSIAGSLGGGLAAMLYALFKPSVVMASWVSYYYWAIPFSALSLVFWTTIYKPESKIYSLRFSVLLFFLYGMIIGFAVSIRLNFLFLPLCLSSLVFFREKTFKRALILVFAMLIGQGILLAPQILITHKYYGKYTLSTRGKWHHVISGLGAYPNPFGIEGSGDITAVNWAINRGGPDLNKAGIQEYDKFMKKEAIRLFKERPDIFLKNFLTNLYAGITLTPRDRAQYLGGPVFYGIVDNSNKTDEALLPYDKSVLTFAYASFWLFFLSLPIMFIFNREKFWPLIAVMLQGLYLIGILCIYFPPVAVHTTAYFPVYVLLLAVAVSVFIKAAISCTKAGYSCWLSENRFANWFAKAKEYFSGNTDKVCSVPVRNQSSGIWVNEIKPKLDWLVLGALLVFGFTGFILLKTLKYAPYVKTDQNAVKIADNILNSETNGNFETWNQGDNMPPDGWLYVSAKGGAIARATDIRNVKYGRSSVEVRPGVLGNSHLMFQVTGDKLYYLLGKTIIVSAWVKSDNKIKNKVSILLHNSIDPEKHIAAYYQNSEEWEKLTLIYKVPDDILGMHVFLNVDEGVSTPVYFDGVGIKYAENAIEEVSR